SERTEELSTNRQEGERLGNVQHAVHVTHRSGYAEASEPTEHFLRSMCEENDSQNEPENGHRDAVVGGEQSVKHVWCPSSLGYEIKFSRTQAPGCAVPNRKSR